MYTTKLSWYVLLCASGKALLGGQISAVASFVGSAAVASTSGVNLSFLTLRPGVGSAAWPPVASLLAVWICLPLGRGCSFFVSSLSPHVAVVGTAQAGSGAGILWDCSSQRGGCEISAAVAAAAIAGQELLPDQ